MTEALLDAAVIWHDLECGGYRADLGVWRELAATADGSVLDVGAGTGRVALDLAGRGHEVVALDRDPRLLDALAQRARGLPVRTLLADARAFTADREVALCLVPMQTIQLLGGPIGRAGLLRCAQRCVRSGGVLAVALAVELEPFEPARVGALPAPDRRRVGSTLFCSQPVAVRERPEGFVLERMRTTWEPSGATSATRDVVLLDRVSPDELELEAAQAGWQPRERRWVEATDEHVGSVVVMLGG